MSKKQTNSMFCTKVIAILRFCDLLEITLVKTIFRDHKFKAICCDI